MTLLYRFLCVFLSLFLLTCSNTTIPDPEDLFLDKIWAHIDFLNGTWSYSHRFDIETECEEVIILGENKSNTHFVHQYSAFPSSLISSENVSFCSEFNLDKGEIDKRLHKKKLLDLSNLLLVLKQEESSNFYVKVDLPKSNINSDERGILNIAGSKFHFLSSQKSILEARYFWVQENRYILIRFKAPSKEVYKEGVALKKFDLYLTIGFQEKELIHLNHKKSNAQPSHLLVEYEYEDKPISNRDKIRFYRFDKKLNL